MVEPMERAVPVRGPHSFSRLALAFFLFFGVLPTFLFAQTSSITTPSSTDGKDASAKTLPRSFHSLTLGMGVDEVKAALAADDLFVFRGDRDVSLLPTSDQVLIETTGLSFVKRAFFQFQDGKLFMMAFELNTDKVDHYSVFTQFVGDYGDPNELDPRGAVWLSDATRVSIERPLTVKYIDRPTFETLGQASRVKESNEAILRKDFLNGF